MYNVLLVDDEREIRQGLRLKIDWQQLGLQIVGEAGNGQEALEWLQTGDCDILITDMRMPIMDGVELLESCSRKYPAIRLIVLTGYDDFQYAHAAIKNRASDLLLKPVSRSELAEALTRVASELERERSAQEERKLAEWKLSRYLEEMKEQFINSVIKAYPGGSHLWQERIRLYGLSELAVQPVRFVAIGLTPLETPDESGLRLPFELLCRELAGTTETGPGIPVFREAKHPDLLFAIVPGDLEAVQRFSIQVTDIVRRYLKREALVIAGEPTQGLEAWREGYLSAVLAWYMGQHALQPEGELTRGPADPAQLAMQDKLKLLQRHLADGRKEAFEKLVEEELTKALAFSHPQFVKLIFQCCLSIELAADTLGFALRDKDEIWIDPEWVWGLGTVPKACHFLYGLADPLFTLKKGCGTREEPSIVEAMKDMIELNYMNDLNLSQIAEQYHYNLSYLSDLFKTKTGKSFLQYLTDVRMNKAVQLLDETPLALSDIAELTGFSNASYFSTRFKKVFGISPSEHRQSDKS
ncbi:response regulator [Paenibacillus sp. MBLB2552]|uniref:Response regulator n=1 Tax=Paenibacillus mellifer TaxID=2937794 RepID=A0A9X1Y104_9BACL|nr:response regulator [Paenibacillus mellifer]MCK8487358.1 response regulator [Paenibacillus mellifer]